MSYILFFLNLLYLIVRGKLCCTKFLKGDLILPKKNIVPVYEFPNIVNDSPAPTISTYSSKSTFNGVVYSPILPNYPESLFPQV